MNEYTHTSTHVCPFPAAFSQKNAKKRQQEKVVLFLAKLNYLISLIQLNSAQSGKKLLYSTMHTLTPAHPHTHTRADIATGEEKKRKYFF